MYYTKIGLIDTQQQVRDWLKSEPWMVLRSFLDVVRKRETARGTGGACYMNTLLL